MLGRIWNRMLEAVRGLKTYIVAGLLVIVGLADYFDAFTIRPVLEHFIGEDYAGLVVVLLPIVFAGLRYITNSSPAGRREVAAKGNIDVPDETSDEDA